MESIVGRDAGHADLVGAYHRLRDVIRQGYVEPQRKLDTWYWRRHECYRAEHDLHAGADASPSLTDRRQMGRTAVLDHSVPEAVPGDASEPRRRKVTDHHVRLREQRPRLMVIGIAFVLVGLTLLVVLDGPQGLIALVGAMVGGLGSSILVTLFWKISIHVAVVSGAVTILILVFGPSMLLLAPLVALVAWARIDLQDHTPAQTIAGALLGAMAAGLLFPLLS